MSEHPPKGSSESHKNSHKDESSEGIHTEPVIYNPDEEVRSREEDGREAARESLQRNRENREAEDAESGAAAEDDTVTQAHAPKAAALLAEYNKTQHHAGSRLGKAWGMAKGVFGVLWAWIKQAAQGASGMAGKGGGGGGHGGGHDDHGGGGHH